MANQLRVTLISTELAYIVFAVSIFCSTTETAGQGVIPPDLFLYRKAIFLPLSENRVHTIRESAVLLGNRG